MQGAVQGSAECALCAQSGTLKAALLDYTKRCRPGDSEKHNMIALCFSMCREIGQNHEAAACTQLKLIESRPWGEQGLQRGGPGTLLGLSLPGGGSCPEQFLGALEGRCSGWDGASPWSRCRHSRVSLSPQGLCRGSVKGWGLCLCVTPMGELCSVSSQCCQGRDTRSCAKGFLNGSGTGQCWDLPQRCGWGFFLVSNPSTRLQQSFDPLTEQAACSFLLF